MDKIADWLIDKVNRWYVKSSLPMTVKEFIFLFVVLTAILSCDAWAWIKNVIRRRS